MFQVLVSSIREYLTLDHFFDDKLWFNYARVLVQMSSWDPIHHAIFIRIYKVPYKVKIIEEPSMEGIIFRILGPVAGNIDGHKCHLEWIDLFQSSSVGKESL
ncbi:hypothetical protein VNO77_15355 [Canavalia gladiata]|uniref:Uncharacterized protein n=1 Tax=Canavalia gladiata TaxID=3824 RepID=A0AAN9M2M0_CANGL